MPLLKGASSEYTMFIKYNALTLPAAVVKSNSAVALPNASIISTLTKASAVAAKASPSSSVLTQTKYGNIVPAAPLYLPVSVGSYQIFIVKYDTNGVAKSYSTFQAAGLSTGRGITVDSTGVYVSGWYRSTSTVTLNNGKTLPISVSQDGFIIKYDLSGNAQWATTISGTGSDNAGCIATDSTGVYVAGYYYSTSTVTLNNGKTLPISVSTDTFIIKYDLSGNAQWATTISGTPGVAGNAITVDSTGVYVAGYYSSTSQILLTNGS